MGRLALLTVLLAPGAARAEGIDLEVVRLEGLVDARTPETLQAAAARAAHRGEGLLLVIDSPGGDLQAAKKAMLTILFSDVPVVAWIPPDGQAAGAAVLPVLGCSTIAVASSARLGSRKGLGRFAAAALGPFGERLFAAASEARSGSVDWMIVTLSEGGRIDARGALRRGVATVQASTLPALGHALRGRRVAVPLTARIVTLSGREHEQPGSLAARLRRPWRSPAALACLLPAALLALALGLRRPSWGPFTVVALVALGVVVRAADSVPIDGPAVLLVGLGALALGAGAAVRGAGVALVPIGALLVGLGARGFVDLDAPGQYLDPSAAVPGLLAVTVALALAAGSLLLRGAGAGARESWRIEGIAIESPGPPETRR